ncbi:MAG: thiamine pyrophosphate-dependent dehydrogenase E1 component subunit alpha [Streptosporangiaceae bacterium]
MAVADSDAAVADLDLLARMWLIRAFEEKASECFARGWIRGLLHLSIGQEAVAVGACSVLRREDVVVSGHRPHGHLLAKGGDPRRLMAELAGRATGYCGGKGGSMHISAPDVGFLTATGVVGGNIPLALGGALAGLVRADGRIACVFFGDGAGQAGAFHESLNLAALWRLPVIFVCENNGYAEFSALAEHTVVERLASYAAVYGIPSVTAGGNDVKAVRTLVNEAAERARSGGGPSFVEALTYRLRGHYEGDPSKYRELAELQEWKAKDPIARFAAVLRETGRLDDEVAAEIEDNARRVVDAATEAALADPEPGAASIVTGVYA